jgi:hypothetical protein
MSLPPVPGWALSRRTLGILALAGGVEAILAACGRSATPATSPSSHGGSSSGGAGTQAGTRGGVVELGGAHVADGQAISVADAQRIGTVADGGWIGGWHDDSGASGTTDVSVAIDAGSRTARATIAASGPLLGSGIGSQTYAIDLLSFLLAADSYTIVSPQFGHVVITVGVGTVSATATHVPGHPEIAQITVNGIRVARRVDAGYTIHYVDGHTVKGTMAWSGTETRATPQPLSSGGAPSDADVYSGDYAAGLIDASRLTTIFGEAFPAPSPNGGRLGYGPGINVSNATCTAQSGDYNLAYQIYIGKDAAATAAFWRASLVGQPSVAGPWTAGYYYTETATFYAYLPTRVITVNIVPLGTGAPTAAGQRQLKQRSIDVATAITNALAAA